MKTKEEILGPPCYPHECGSMVEVQPQHAVLKAMEEYAEQSAPKWISVKDRLPETNCSVLVLDPNNPFNKSMDVARFDEYQKCFFFSGLDKIHPTHWMPLPEPPKDNKPNE